MTKLPFILLCELIFKMVCYLSESRTWYAVWKLFQISLMWYIIAIKKLEKFYNSLWFLPKIRFHLSVFSNSEWSFSFSNRSKNIFLRWLNLNFFQKIKLLFIKIINPTSNLFKNYTYTQYFTFIFWIFF